MTTTMKEEDIEKELTKADKRKIIFLISSVLLFSVMNGTMFMIAVPDVAKSFSLSPSEVSWIVTGYIILYAIGALMYGKLADIYPLKYLLAVGLSLFAAGSIIGFFSPNFIMVVVARMIQATGASSIVATVFIIPSRYFSNERGKVLGIVSSTMAFASGIGPVIGGFITGVLSWQYLFLISACVLITIPFFWKWMPDEKKKEGKVDILGAAFVAIAVATLLLFVTLLVWWYIIISIVFFTLFAWRIFHSKDPFVNPEMFGNAPYRTTVISAFLAIMAMFGMMFMLPLMLSEVNDLNALYIGLVLFPGAMAAAFTGRVAGVLTEKKGSKQVVFMAFALMMIGFFLISSLIGSPAWVLSIVIIISYIAFPFIQTATANLLSIVLPKREIGVGMGIYNLFNFMAGAFGGAVIGKILDYNSSFSLNPFAIAENHAMIYSNVFAGLIVLTLLNGAFFYFSFKRNGSESVQ
ncbi:MFS transporter [Gracilibacillus massiliensis]|uniref:MFS transporter n=1 Tax=Gracilibacillus massiliensis TaxID=1564956 RepID=UPI00071DCE10|nr:MFS transporter [Gracilibacillus massiliensis]